jgi:hypothetical protein
VSVTTPPTYLYVLSDAPGVVLANTFISMFNPANSGKTITITQIDVEIYGIGVTVAQSSMLRKRITAASSGTLIAASTISRFKTSYVDPALEVRIGNPTVTTSALAHGAHTPIVSTKEGLNAASYSVLPVPLMTYRPGEGMCMSTAAGNINQTWSISLVWQER